MSFSLPIQTPLTESQAELTSKIGSMQSLISSPLSKSINIPKDNQISTFDYLIKVLKAMGLSPEFIFQSFFSLVFDTTTDFLEKKVLLSISSSLAKKGRDLTSPTSASIINPSEAQINQLKEANYVLLSNAIPTTFLTGVKRKMSEDLIRMIFGPFDKIGDGYTTSQKQKMQRDAICGINAFSMSNKPYERNEDMEYNKVQLKKQLDAGIIQFEISCQDVKVSLPEDIGVVLNGIGVNGSIPSTQVTPVQSISFLVEYVESQVQNINNQNNSNTSGKRFWQILLERFFNYISTLVVPHVGAVFSFINTLPSGAGLNENNVLYSVCEIENDQENKEKKEFTKSLTNSLLKELLKLMLIFLIKKFKILVKNFFARKSRERSIRNSNKIKARFNLISSVGDSAEKTAKYASALSSLSSILKT